MPESSSERRKLFEELQQRPANVDFGELQTLMELWNYERIRLALSGNWGIFAHKVFDVEWLSVPIPPEGEPVLETFVEDCFESVRDVIHLEESGNGQ